MQYKEAKERAISLARIVGKPFTVYQHKLGNNDLSVGTTKFSPKGFYCHYRSDSSMSAEWWAINTFRPGFCNNFGA